MGALCWLLSGLVLGNIWATYDFRAMISACIFGVLLSIAFIRTHKKEEDYDE